MLVAVNQLLAAKFAIIHTTNQRPYLGRIGQRRGPKHRLLERANVMLGGWRNARPVRVLLA